MSSAVRDSILSLPTEPEAAPGVSMTRFLWAGGLAAVVVWTLVFLAIDGLFF